jgi:hypothetical protein
MQSRESEIDCRMRELIARMARRIITRDEEAELHMLQRERVNRMMPKEIARHRVRRG